MMKKYFGLIPARHVLPEVEGYVFPAELDPLDFQAMAAHVRQFLAANADIHTTCGVGLNSCEDSQVFAGNVHLCVYVTGLTAATAALISECAYNGVPLTLYHFNRDTGEYVPQVIFPE